MDAAGLLRGELVGLHAAVVRSCNPGIVGASGMVVGETKNMLVMSPPAAGMRGPHRSYPKAGSVWRFGAAAAAAAAAGADGPDAAPWRTEIDGSLIARRPEDRLRVKLPPAARPGRQSGGAGP